MHPDDATLDSRQQRGSAARSASSRARALLTRACCCGRRRAGLVIGFGWLPAGAAGAGAGRRRRRDRRRSTPNAFVRIGTDNTRHRHLQAPRDGPGQHHRPATLVADELDADWAQVRTECAPADAKRYNNLAFGPMQGTGGSHRDRQLVRAVPQGRRRRRARCWSRRRRDAWNVPAGEITRRKGVLTPCVGPSAPPSARWPTRRARSRCRRSRTLKDAERVRAHRQGPPTPRVDSPRQVQRHARSTPATSSCRACSPR